MIDNLKSALGNSGVVASLSAAMGSGKAQTAISASANPQTQSAADIDRSIQEGMMRRAGKRATGMAQFALAVGKELPAVSTGSSIGVQAPAHMGGMAKSNAISL